MKISSVVAVLKIISVYLEASLLWTRLEMGYMFIATFVTFVKRENCS